MDSTLLEQPLRGSPLAGRGGEGGLRKVEASVRLKANVSKDKACDAEGWSTRSGAKEIRVHILLGHLP